MLTQLSVLGSSRWMKKPPVWVRMLAHQKPSLYQSLLSGLEPEGALPPEP